MALTVKVSFPEQVEEGMAISVLLQNIRIMIIICYYAFYLESVYSIVYHADCGCSIFDPFLMHGELYVVVPEILMTLQYFWFSEAGI